MRWGGDLLANENANPNADSSKLATNPNTQNADSAESATDSTDSPQTPRILTQTYDLGRIERVVQSAPDSNESVATITAQDFENTTSNNVAEALRFAPGVFYGAPNGSKAGADIKIRGFSGDRGLSEVSISKGYTSPQYGMNTLGGAVNIITSKPMDKFEAGIKYSFISNNEHSGMASLGTNLGTFYTQATYGYTYRDSFPLSHKYTPSGYQTTLEKRNSYLKNHTLRFKIGLSQTQTTSIR